MWLLWLAHAITIASKAILRQPFGNLSDSLPTARRQASPEETKKLRRGGTPVRYGPHLHLQQ